MTRVCLRTLLCVTILLASCNLAGASSTLFTQHNIATLTDLMASMDQPTFDRLQEIDPLVFPKGIGAKDIFVVNLPAARFALDLIVSENLGSMDFFGHTFWGQEKRLLFYPKEILTVINKEYNISALFISHGISKGKYFEIEALLLGHGRIVVLYPFPIQVHRNDRPYDFLTGNYDYYRMNIALINADPKEKPALYDLKGRNHADENLRPVRGPLGVPLEAITLSPDGKSVRVSVGFAWWTFEHPRFQKFLPPLYDRRPEAINIPAVALGNARRLAEAP